jgi:DNA end-binding protein Ku
MASRPVWKGQLRLSLVAIPVEMYSATQTGARIKFRQIHEPSGKPVHYQKIVNEIGPVNTDEIFKGYEYEKDEYVLIDPEEVDAIKLETKKTIELVQFVGACEIPPLYFDQPYYLVPSDELAEEAYRVVRDALRATEKAGLGQVTMRGREYLVAVRSCGDGLLLETLHYADEIKAAEPLFSQVEDEQVNSDLLDVAVNLIAQKSSAFDANRFKDHYTLALRELLRRKTGSKKSKKVTTDEPAASHSADNVVDLMTALKASLKKAGGRKSAPSGRKSGARKSAASKSSGTKAGRSG